MMGAIAGSSPKTGRGRRHGRRRDSYPRFEADLGSLLEPAG